MVRSKNFDVSKYGLTMAEWDRLTELERNRLSSQANYWARKERASAEEMRAFWKRKYAANPQGRRDNAKRCYYRHHELQLARGRARWAKVRSIDTIRRDPDQIYLEIVAAIGRGLPRHARDDIAAEICLAVLEGTTLVKNIRSEVSRYVAAYNREYDTFKTVSLDSQVPGTAGLTYLDRLSSESNET